MSSHFFWIVCEKEVARMLLHTALHALIRGLVNAGHFDPEGTMYTEYVFKWECTVS